MPLIRINKFLSQSGIASRRKADELIANGVVSVNGKILRELGLMIDTERDTVSVNGKKIATGKAPHLRYFLLNKPKGYISTLSDERGRKTVMDLVPRISGLFPAGRLDKDTTGLIIITNDGELANRLTHPSFEIDKVYEIEIKGEFLAADRYKVEKGVDIGERRDSALEVTTVRPRKSSTKIILRIHEGRKRQIRRTFEALGYVIRSLKRISYCGFNLDVDEGNFRELSLEEIRTLKNRVGLT